MMRCCFPLQQNSVPIDASKMIIVLHTPEQCLPQVIRPLRETNYANKLCLPASCMDTQSNGGEEGRRL